MTQALRSAAWRNRRAQALNAPAQPSLARVLELGGDVGGGVLHDVASLVRLLDELKSAPPATPPQRGQLVVGERQHARRALSVPLRIGGLRMLIPR